MITAIINGFVSPKSYWRSVLCLLMFSLAASGIAAQSGGHKLYGDMKGDESKASGVVPISFDVILYNLSGNVLGRQSVPNRGRNQFFNVADGQYDVVVEVENKEVARLRVQISSPFKTDFRQDIELEWHSPYVSTRPGTISASDFYKRSPSNQKRFEKAQEATDKKRYAESIALLKEILANQPDDFQSWTELGTVYLIENNLMEAENSYLKATELRPEFFLALMNLGRLRMLKKDFDGAISILSQAVEKKPDSADANFYLGEAYLQIKKGSRAVGYLNEAARFGKAEAHLRLALLYNGAGLKEKAAAEYEAFLKKKPDYPDRKKLEEYISANKSAANTTKP